MKRFLAVIFSGFILAIFLYYLFNGFTAGSPGQLLDSRLKEAYSLYKQGEKGETVAERKLNFNGALHIYDQLDEEYHPNFGNGKLYYDIANTYFQLGEYPWSVLYYNRALALMPRNSDAQRNLAVTLDKLNLKVPPTNSTFHQLFFLYYDFSLPERLQGFFFVRACRSFFHFPLCLVAKHSN